MSTSSEPLLVADLLRRYRLAVGLTQEELAAQAGLSTRAISDLERGARTAPRKETVTLLANALGLSTEDRAALLTASRRSTVPTARPLRYLHPVEAGSGMTTPQLAPERAASLRMLDRSAHNLPVQPTPLVGRQEAVASIAALLGRDDVRLVTLTGPGGVGKTRLGLQVAAAVADAFADGVWLVRLSPLSDPTLVVPTIAQTLGVKEGGDHPLAETVRGYVRSKRLLLLLDNFEQVLGAASEVAALLESSTGLRVLVTSRVVLHLRGEKEIAVPPLALADAAHLSVPEHVAQSPAVALFIQRAQDANPTFQLTRTTAPIVATICAQLDGLPLAIELAAARSKLLSPSTLLQRLEPRLPMLTGGARDLPARQQTMRATITWSYDLLSPVEQRLFRRLAVFVGGCTLQAAEAVCAAPEDAEVLGLDVLEGLSALVDQSLVQRTASAEGTVGTVGTEESEPRFRPLYVMREYALEQLEASGEAEALRRAHVAYFEALAEQAYRGVMTGIVDAQSVQQLAREHDNLRAALAWLCTRGEAERGLRLAVGVSALWEYAGHFTEGRRWLDELLAMGSSEAPGDPAVRVQALRRSSVLASTQHDVQRAVTRGEEALALARGTGDLDLLATALSWKALMIGLAKDVAPDRLEQAQRDLEEGVALARHVRSTRLAWHLRFLGTVKVLRGEVEPALSLFRESVDLARQAGDRETLAHALQGLGAAYCLLGNAATARPLLEEALHAYREQGYLMGIAWTLLGLAGVSVLEGRGERSARLFGAQETLLSSGSEHGFALGMPLAEQLVAEARATLGEERWSAAYAAGRVLSLKEAVALALGEERKHTTDGEC
jgi:predicted ATPase/transcriptional regulator with XRE-family HTH domain